MERQRITRAVSSKRGAYMGAGNTSRWEARDILPVVKAFEGTSTIFKAAKPMSCANTQEVYPAQSFTLLPIRCQASCQHFLLTCWLTRWTWPGTSVSEPGNSGSGHSRSSSGYATAGQLHCLSILECRTHQNTHLVKVLSVCNDAQILLVRAQQPCGKVQG